MRKDVKKIVVLLGTCFVFTCSSAMIVWLDRNGWIPENSLNKFKTECAAKNGVYKTVTTTEKSPQEPSVYGTCVCREGFKKVYKEDSDTCVPM